MTSKEKREMIRDGKKSGMSTAEMSRAYQVSTRTIQRLFAMEKSSGNMMPHTSRCGRKSALSADELRQMKELIEQRPDMTLFEIKEKMNLTICLSAIHRIIRGKLGFTYKKRQYMPQNETPRV